MRTAYLLFRKKGARSETEKAGSTGSGGALLSSRLPSGERALAV